LTEERAQAETAVRQLLFFDAERAFLPEPRDENVFLVA
jgi:hypothetical protein